MKNGQWRLIGNPLTTKGVYLAQADHLGVVGVTGKLTNGHFYSERLRLPEDMQSNCRCRLKFTSIRDMLLLTVNRWAKIEHCRESMPYGWRWRGNKVFVERNLRGEAVQRIFDR